MAIIAEPVLTNEVQILKKLSSIPLNIEGININSVTLIETVLRANLRYFKKCYKKMALRIIY